MKRILYLGFKVPKHLEGSTHYPILDVVECPSVSFDLSSYTHIFFSSQVAVDLFFKRYSLDKNPLIFAVGKATAASLLDRKVEVSDVCQEESQEGMISLIQSLSKRKEDHYLFPRSLLARSCVTDYLDQVCINYTVLPLYTVRCKQHLPDVLWEEVDAIFFTSPSTVDAFLERFGTFPRGKELLTIGPVTQKHLDRVQSRRTLGDPLCPLTNYPI